MIITISSISKTKKAVDWLATGFTATAYFVISGADLLHAPRMMASLARQSWRTAWQKMTQAAGLSHVHFHDLRHTALTRGREQGVDIGILKAIAGHMDARMTEYYIRVGSPVKRNAVDRIGETYRPVALLLGLEDSTSDPVN